MLITHWMLLHRLADLNVVHGMQRRQSWGPSCVWKLVCICSIVLAFLLNGRPVVACDSIWYYTCCAGLQKIFVSPSVTFLRAPSQKQVEGGKLWTSPAFPLVEKTYGHGEKTSQRWSTWNILSAVYWSMFAMKLYSYISAHKVTVLVKMPCTCQCDLDQVTQINIQQISFFSLSVLVSLKTWG